MGSAARRLARNVNQAEWDARGISEAQIAKALYHSDGHAFDAAGRLGVAKTTVYRKIAASLRLRKLRLEIQKDLLEHGKKVRSIEGMMR